MDTLTPWRREMCPQLWPPNTSDPIPPPTVHWGKKRDDEVGKMADKSDK